MPRSQRERGWSLAALFVRQERTVEEEIDGVKKLLHVGPTNILFVEEVVEKDTNLYLYNIIRIEVMVGHFDLFTRCAIGPYHIRIG
jgi:hypothetical protein